MEMSADALTVAIVTSCGGLLAWALAAIFDYVLQDHRYQKEKVRVETTIGLTPDYAATVGDIDQHLTSLGAGPARMSEAALRNAVQPLLVLALVAAASLRVLTKAGWVVESTALFMIGLIICLTIVHELKGKTDWQGIKKYWATVIVAWIAEIVIVFLLSRASAG